MPFESSPAAAGWPARLALAFEERDGATVLARREHRGPLVVQKPLYPEGRAVCHAILVHPPAGIAGGDVLEVDVEAAGAARALITTPGATKWYRSTGAAARQSVAVRAYDEAVVEWLPQEAIVFDGARAAMHVDVALFARATFIGLEVLCLGRTASGERFRAGTCEMRVRVERNGAPLWSERGVLEGGGKLLESPVGLDNQPVTATLIAASPAVAPDLVAACRELRCETGRTAVTMLPGLLVARWLGPACEPARQWLARIWSAIRPALAGRAATMPRIWNT